MFEEVQLWLKNWNQQEDKEVLYQICVFCMVDLKFGLLFVNGKVVWGFSDKLECECNFCYFGYLGCFSKKFCLVIFLYYFYGDNYFYFVVWVLSKLFFLENFCIFDNMFLFINEVCICVFVFREVIDSGIFGG